jgi:hypothetical protein
VVHAAAEPETCRQVVQVEFDEKGEKRFANEALERYPNLANMLGEFIEFFTKSARCNVSCLYILDGFCLRPRSRFLIFS